MKDLYNDVNNLYNKRSIILNDTCVAYNNFIECKEKYNFDVSSLNITKNNERKIIKNLKINKRRYYMNKYLLYKNVIYNNRLLLYEENLDKLYASSNEININLLNCFPLEKRYSENIKKLFIENEIDNEVIELDEYNYNIIKNIIVEINNLLCTDNLDIDCKSTEIKDKINKLKVRKKELKLLLKNQKRIVKKEKNDLYTAKMNYKDKYSLALENGDKASKLLNYYLVSDLNKTLKMNKKK